MQCFIICNENLKETASRWSSWYMYYHYYKVQWPLCWPRFIVCLWFSVEPPTEFGYLCHHARITGACGKSSAVLWMCSYLNIIPPHPTLPDIDEHLGSAIDVLGLSSLLQPPPFPPPHTCVSMNIVCSLTLKFWILISTVVNTPNLLFKGTFNL